MSRRNRTSTITCPTRKQRAVWFAIGVLFTLALFATDLHASAVVGTYFEEDYLIADGSTVYRLWVYADNTGLGGDITDDVHYRPILEPFITPVPGSFGRAPADRDFFEGKPLFFQAIAPLGSPSGAVVFVNEGSANKFGDMQFYDVTINPGTAIGLHEVGISTDWTFLADPAFQLQPYAVQNQPFKVIPSIPGDADTDGDIDLDDFDTLTSNFGQNAGMTWFDGDFDLDGDVDFDDFARLALHFGESADIANPTPATGALLIASLIGVLRRPYPGQ